MANNSLKYEDTVQCLYFVNESNGDLSWDSLCNSLNETAYNLSHEYIWHRDEFRISHNLYAASPDCPPHLTSITCFGDCIEDEWFIIYIIFQLTEKYPNLVVQIEDNDGDLLLIESADFLPSWANPETTQNRVFVYRNHVHLIPPSLANLAEPLNLTTALKIITEHTEESRAPYDIEEAVKQRISSYPHKIKDLCHKATVSIPVEIAALIILKPKLISNFVNIYCNHDAIDKKLCQKVKFNNCVDVTIKFTKLQYAMLQHFKSIKNYVAGISSSNMKSEIGFKLTCAYKIIMDESKKDKFSSMDFKKFLDSLVKKNYFNGNIEGSRDYELLLEKAKKYYMEMESPMKSYVSENVTQVVSSKEYDKIKETLIQNPLSYLQIEDSNDWLNVDPNELDDLLNKNYKNKVQSEDLITPSVVTTGLSNFLAQKSDFAGVEESQSTNGEDNNIKFDPEQFLKTVEKMLNMVTLNLSDDDSSDFSDNEDEKEFDITDEQVDEELENKLCNGQIKTLKDDSCILSNLKASMKEEGLVGPTSNILRSIGISKSEVLDSDDDIQ